MKETKEKMATTRLRIAEMLEEDGDIVGAERNRAAARRLMAA